jgi:hypothetical protein
MENNKFFKWIGRINSILFLTLIVLSIGFVIFGIFQSNKWSDRDVVEVRDEKGAKNTDEELKLSDITNVCGKDIRYLELRSEATDRGLSSGGYGHRTRNLIFFVGKEMESHWLFENNNYLIEKVVQLKREAHGCETQETTAIYYEVIKDDSNKNGKLDLDDLVSVAITSPDGLNYKKLDTGLTSVLDHDVDAEASILTILGQHKNTLFMKKYSLKTGEKISEKELSKISKEL